VRLLLVPLHFFHVLLSDWSSLETKSRTVSIAVSPGISNGSSETEIAANEDIFGEVYVIIVLTPLLTWDLRY
jgi:hypothetical protein